MYDLQDALEAQNRQLMEQSMAYQQQYAQYGGYGQQMYPGMVPPIMQYGAPIPPPPMGYATPSADYYAAQQPYDPSLQSQQQHKQIQPPTQSQPPREAGQANIPSNNSIGEQQVPMVASTAGGPAPEQKQADSFDMHGKLKLGFRLI